MKMRRCPECKGKAILTRELRSTNPYLYYIHAQCSECGYKSIGVFSSGDPIDMDWEDEASEDAIRLWNGEEL